MRLSHAARTDVGMKRDNNEDNFLAFPEQNLWAVFDGMGGHAAGEVASGIAVQELKEFYEMTGKDPDATWPFRDSRELSYDENRLVTSIKLANARIIETANQDARKKSMGTTCVSAHFLDRKGTPTALVAHTGDSRVYRFRGTKLTRVTIDHSLVEEYLRMGKINEEEAKNFPQKNIILRALGQIDKIDVEIHAYELEAGDVYLLCSDGLSGMIEDNVMESIIARSLPSLEVAAKKLIDTANANGGVDNITAVLVRYDGP